MPYPNLPEDKTAAMDECVRKVMAGNPELDKSQAIAICYKQVAQGSISLYQVNKPEDINFVLSAEESGDVLRFRNAILAVAEVNKNRDEIDEEGIREIAATLPGRPIDDDHDYNRNVGVFTAARAVPVTLGSTETWGVSTDGLIWADRWPHVAEDVQTGKGKLSIEAGAKKAICSICGGEFSSTIEYCTHLLHRAATGAVRRLKGLRAKGGAITRNPAGTGCEFDATAVYFVASHQEDAMEGIEEVIDVVEENWYDAKTLTYQQRKDLPDSAFALIQYRPSKRDPKKKIKVRRFPINDCEHARNALARLPNATDLTDEERAQVKRKAQKKLNSSECKNKTEGNMDDIEKAMSQLNAALSQIESLTSERDALQSKVEALSSERDELSAKVDKLVEQNKSVDKRVAELEQQLAETVLAHRLSLLGLPMEAEKDEDKKRQEIIGSMTDAAFDLYLEASKNGGQSQVAGSGGFSPAGDNNAGGKPPLEL
ncbi:MAG: hypothetical protein OCU12_06065 [Methanophagales archaeon]|nr:hypothetical protein [Methanophagales archaeon]